MSYNIWLIRDFSARGLPARQRAIENENMTGITEMPLCHARPTRIREYRARIRRTFEKHHSE